MSNGPLSDIRVVEYSIGPSGAMCAKTFADMGADVIKVEPPDGDPARRLGPFPNDVPNPEASGIFLYLNANKRGATLDLTRGDDRRRLYDLAADADVFVCDLRPTDALALGIDSATMASLSPSLIPTYVTPFGSAGQYSDWHGTDLIAWHMGGLGWESPAAFVTDTEKHTPLRGRGNQAMYFAGWVAAAGAMCALFHRETYGLGQEIDVSAMDAVASHIRGNFAGYSYDISKLPESREKVMFPWIWKVADGYASMTFFLDHWWQTMKEVMGNPDWMDDAELDTFAGRRENLELIETKVGAWARGMKRADLYETLQSRGVPCFPVQTVDEVTASKHYAERGFFAEARNTPSPAKSNSPARRCDSRPRRGACARPLRRSDGTTQTPVSIIAERELARVRHLPRRATSHWTAYASLTSAGYCPSHTPAAGWVRSAPKSSA